MQRDRNSKKKKKKREYQKEMPKIINSVAEMKAFDVFINRLDMAEEILSELKAMSTETSKTENKREKKKLKTRRREYPRTCGTTAKWTYL